MAIVDGLRDAWNDDAWLVAVVAGAISIPAILVVRAHVGGTYMFVPPFVAGLVVGSLTAGITESGREVGLRAGWSVASPCSTRLRSF